MLQKIANTTVFLHAYVSKIVSGMQTQISSGSNNANTKTLSRPNVFKNMSCMQTHMISPSTLQTLQHLRVPTCSKSCHVCKLIWSVFQHCKHYNTFARPISKVMYWVLPIFIVCHPFCGTCEKVIDKYHDSRDKGFLMHPHGSLHLCSKPRYL